MERRKTVQVVRGPDSMGEVRIVKTCCPEDPGSGDFLVVSWQHYRQDPIGIRIQGICAKCPNSMNLGMVFESESGKPIRKVHCCTLLESCQLGKLEMIDLKSETGVV